MFEDIPGWLQVAGLAIGLLTLATTAFAVASSTWFKTKSDVKDKIIEDSDKRIKQLEEETARKDREAAAKEAELAKEREARRVLESTVTGKEQLEALTRLLEQHDQRTVDRLDSLIVEGR